MTARAAVVLLVAAFLLVAGLLFGGGSWAGPGHHRSAGSTEVVAMEPGDAGWCVITGHCKGDD